MEADNEQTASISMFRSAAIAEIALIVALAIWWLA